MARPPDTNLAATFDLLDLGMQMRAERYRRENPQATDEEVHACVRAWLLDRPGAPDGDAPGHPVAFPRPA